MKFPRAYDATITRADFVRLLPEATGQPEFEERDGAFHGSGWCIRFASVAPLEIGMVRLERYRVDIQFDGLDAEAEEAFMRRFTLTYQRGGG
ncbi:MAG: hypothetical protein HZB40_20130 [Rhodocyclales bacterium]|nr:hypothetical protein [Rhodocyclales bacterium]